MAQTPTSPHATEIGSFPSRSSTNASKPRVEINKLSPQVIANEHHAHNCCNKRYHCDGSKCPDGPIVNPAIGVPLAICTAGLSQAAFGIYRGVRDHRTRKKIQAAYLAEQTRQNNLETAEISANEALKPSAIPLGESASHKAFEAGVTRTSAEVEGTPIQSKDQHTFGEQSKAELDGVALAPPPMYAAELDSNEVERFEKPAN